MRATTRAIAISAIAFRALACGTDAEPIVWGIDAGAGDAVIDGGATAAPETGSGRADADADAPPSEAGEVDAHARGGWYALGGSEYGPWTVRPNGSASGGGVSRSAASSTSPTVIVDAQDRPVVAWVETSDTYSTDTPSSLPASVCRWNGSTWEDLGSIPAVTSSFYNRAHPLGLAADGKGGVYAVTSLLRRARVYSWTATGWSELVDAANVSGDGLSGPQLVVDADDTPLLAGEKQNGGVAVRMWTGSGWQEKGAWDGTLLAVTRDPAKHPIVVVSDAMTWDDANPWAGHFSGIHARRWIDGHWEDLGLDGAVLDGTLVAIVHEDEVGIYASVDASGALVLTDLHFVSADAGAGFPYEVGFHRWTGGAWQSFGAHAVGDRGSSDEYSSGAALAAGPGGGLFSAWWGGEDPVTHDRHVARWTGKSWQDLASLGDARRDTYSEYPYGLAVDSADRPTFVWTRNGEVYALRWSDGGWSELGVPTSGGALSQAPGSSLSSLVLDSAGQPTVAWNVGSHLALRRWNGTSWESLGASTSAYGLAPAQGQLPPRLVVDTAGNPSVAWMMPAPDGRPAEVIHLLTWDGSSWNELAGSNTGDGVVAGAHCGSCIPDGAAGVEGTYWNYSLALDGRGHPMLGWEWSFFETSRFTVDVAMYLRTWTGSAWGELGGSATDTGLGRVSEGALLDTNPQSPFAMAADPKGNPVIVYPDYAFTEFPSRLAVHRWDPDSATWTALAQVNALEGIAAPSIAVGPDGHPVVAWLGVIVGDLWSLHLHLLRWDGAAWQALGGSDAGDAITRVPFHGTYALTIDEAGSPIVAWEDQTSGQSQIYLRRWSGLADGEWQEVNGSASGGGVSNGSAAAEGPSVAARGRRICVSWHALGGDGTEVLLRCTER